MSLSKSTGIVRFEADAVILETMTQTVIDSSGRSRKRIACYKIVGLLSLRELLSHSALWWPALMLSTAEKRGENNG